MPTVTGTLSIAASRLVDVLLPPTCPACRMAVDRPGRLCADCWGKVDFIAAPYCASCGLPFGHDHGPATLCGACLADPPAFDRARAVMRYGEIPARLVVGFKHGDQTHLAPALADWLDRAGAELLADADLLLPVPLHPRRLFRRRFNQSALLAHALGRRHGIAVATRLLRRSKPTPSQGGLSRDERLRNVRAGFVVDADARSVLEGRRVVLIDDVFTTGATIDSCARVLRRAGAARVDVLTLARVVRAD
ncbi:MAG: amidophosphoribosyltransferase [Rhodospirillaceae bacterium]|nr:amidophosphoribosyltransferase [Rhodospirillaceae bacterium]